MKKLLLFAAISLFQLTIAFGQTKIENKKGTKGMATGDYKPNRQETPPKTNSINYNDRAYRDECYKNFAFTVKNYGYNKDGKFYSWGVAVKNNYSKAVQLKYKLIVGNDNSQNGTLTYYIKPGETYSNDMGTAKAIIVGNSSDKYKIEVSEVCFEGQDCAKNGYADCNGKQSDKNMNNSTNKTDNRKEFSFNTDITYDVSFNEALAFFKNLGYQLMSQENTQTSIKYYFNGFNVNVWSSRGGIKKGYKAERYMTSMTIVCENEGVLNDLLKKIKCNGSNTECECVSYSNSDTKQYGININRKQ